MMKKLYIHIILPLLMLPVCAQAQDIASKTQMDSIVLGNSYHLNAVSNLSMDSSVFDKSPEVDIAKALYGQFSGLLVKQGTGRSEENQAKLRLHGLNPLVIVDGFPRALNDLTGIEIESVSVLKDASSAALYGVKGANGVILITTKRGEDSSLKVSAGYHYGGAVPFRAPDFADAYTYASMVNQACAMDGIQPRYDANELFAFNSGEYPYAYPNVNWWDQIYRSHGDNHRLELTFTGGSKNFRYFAAIDYMKDDAMYVKPTSDNRYNANTYDNRLGVRANVDVNITKSTSMKIGIMARLSEFNTPYWSTSIDKIVYNTPAAAFPVKQSDGTYGGSAKYSWGSNNPVAMHQESGQHQYAQTKVLANAVLRQDLGMLVRGLDIDASVAFDYIGKLTEVAEKSYRYSELESSIAWDGTTSYLLSKQYWYGVNSKTVEFDHWFNSLSMKFEFTGRINWARTFDKNHIEAHVGYRMRSWIENERNASSKTQEVLGTISYNWNQRLFADFVLNYSGSAYLPKGNRFTLYPAISLGAVVTKEPYIKLYGSLGMSGLDDDLTHELFRQVYSSDNAHGYRFGYDGGSSASGKAEGDLAALTLAPVLSKKATAGIDMKFFRNRLSLNAEYFFDDRSNIFISPKNISEVIGIGVKEQSIGREQYQGCDLSLRWDDRAGDFEYGVYGNAGWLFTKVINDGQAYQQYDYLYHAGNPVGQCYGLEVIGIFQNQMEINNSPKQTFSDVRPGDLKYRDQNADGVIDNQDRVKMFGSTTPLLNFGFGLNLGYKGFKFYADFQGVTGVTVSLLDSPLYKPLVGDGNISTTFLSREIPWTPETAAQATMPRLTTLENSNNYRANSLWYRDGSFIKLRNLGVSYTISRKYLKACDMTVSFTGTNLFSCDNIKFADPEQLGAYYPSTRVFWAGIKFNF
ncbi:MAG: SusC/RagA family TonB-linked outer membrane protein [Bacteroidales bacterium]|nr:SusC/RagA family TonB-linked outer membrane protein [Bacteroidales bacterium]